MIQISFSELTKRYYFLPSKGKKIDITDDIKEIIAAHQLPPAPPLTTDEEAAEKYAAEYITEPTGYGASFTKQAYKDGFKRACTHVRSQQTNLKTDKP